MYRRQRRDKAVQRVLRSKVPRVYKIRSSREGRRRVFDQRGRFRVVWRRLRGGDSRAIRQKVFLARVRGNRLPLAVVTITRVGSVVGSRRTDASIPVISPGVAAPRTTRQEAGRAAFDIAMEPCQAATKLHYLFVSTATLQPGGARSAIGGRGRVSVLAVTASMTAVAVLTAAMITVRVTVVAADAIVAISKGGRGHGKAKACANGRAGVRRGRGGSWLDVSSGFGGRLGIVLGVSGIAAGRVPRVEGLLVIVLRGRVSLRSGIRRITRVISALRRVFLLILVAGVAAVVVIVLLAVGLLGLGMGSMLP